MPPRKTAMKRARLTRKGRKYRERFKLAFHSRDFVGFVKSLHCAVSWCERSDIECAHVVRPRSRGGQWNEVAPLCGPHHREQEKRTAAFNEKYGTDLEATAAAVALRWMERTKPAPMYGPEGALESLRRTSRLTIYDGEPARETGAQTLWEEGQTVSESQSPQRPLATGKLK